MDTMNLWFLLRVHRAIVLIVREPSARDERASCEAASTRNTGTTFLSQNSIQLRLDVVVLLLEHRVALDRVAPDLLIHAGRHPGEIAHVLR